MKNKIQPFILLSIIAFFSLPNDTDTIIDAANLPTASREQIDKFEFIRDKSLGLNVADAVGGYMTLATAKHKRWQGGPWSVVTGYKKMVCGKLQAYDVENGHGDEYDWNLNIIPNAPFQDVIQKAKDLQDSNCNWQKYFIIDGKFAHIQCPSLINGKWYYVYKGKYYTEAALRKFQNVEFFQAEITPDQTLYNNGWFPSDGNENKTTMLGKTIGVYGPWVYDEGHGTRPEIHPCEIIWWKNSHAATDTLMIMGIQDDSNRFDESSDFEGLSVPDENAWAKPPIKSIYRIPFEFDGKHSDHLIINIQELRTLNVVTGNLQGFGDSDDGKQHILRSKQKTMEAAPIVNNILVEVNENQRNGANIGVSFVDIAKKANGNIIGYVQLKTAYGRNNGNEGYQVLKVTVKHPTKFIQAVLNN